MMKNVQLTIGPSVKVLKVIRVRESNWLKFSGFIPYVRTFTPSNYTDQEDHLDQEILNSIKVYYPDSYLHLSQSILFENQLEDNLRLLKQSTGSSLNINIQLFPKIPYSDAPKLVGTPLNLYVFQTEMLLFLSPQSKKIPLIANFFNCEIDHKAIDSLTQTFNVV